MRRSNTQKIGEVLKEYVEALKLRRKMKEVSVHRLWSQLLGPSMSKYTKQLYIKNGILFVSLSSSALRNELMMNKQRIISSLNKEMGEEIIYDIKFQ